MDRQHAPRTSLGLLAGALLFMLLLLAGPVQAQGSTPGGEPDVIVQKDGVLLRGHVAELRPGKSVTLVLLSGETRVIRWADIATSSGPSFAAVAPRPPATPGPGGPAAPTAAPATAAPSAPGASLPAPTILSPQDGTTVSTETIKLRVALPRLAQDGTVTLRALVDGQPAAETRGLVLLAGARDPEEEVVRTITVPIPRRDCVVSVRIEGPAGASEPAVTRLRFARAGFSAKPRLYVLAVGVSQYQKSDLTLRFPAKDAADLAAVLRAQEGRLYESVEARVLTDEMATREGILEGLDWLQRQTTSRDVGVLFIAGHGINDPGTGTYYMLPFDADEEAINRTMISQEDVQRALRGIAGKALLFLDTCHAGSVLPGGKRRGVADLSRFVNELSSADNGVVVYAASTGRQESQEDAQWGNGAFTRAVLEGLRGQAAYQAGRPITVNMLELYVSERVKALTHGAQTPTTAKPGTVPDFPIAVGTLRSTAEPLVAPAPAPQIKAGPLMLGLRLGPSFGVLGGSTQLALGLDLGYALDEARSLYLLLSPQVHLANGWSLTLAGGVQYDIRIPRLRGLYLTPRIQLGVSYLGLGALPQGEGGTFVPVNAVAGLFLPELGVKYVLRAGGGRIHLQLDVFSLPLFFGEMPKELRSSAGERFLLMDYRVLASVGFNLGVRAPRPSLLDPAEEARRSDLERARARRKQMERAARPPEERAWQGADQSPPEMWEFEQKDEGPAPPPSVCEHYIRERRITSPFFLSAYGKGGSCWRGDKATAARCARRCVTLLSGDR